MFQKKKLNVAILAALAATTQQASAEIEEIVVTATKRSVPLQDAPVTIQAIGSKTLEDQNIQEFADYVKYLPNVNAGGRGPGQNEIYIRGAAVDAINITVAESQGSAPNVALYLDEQPVTAGGRNLDVYISDMERIEVLPGPQGTLYGRNTFAGALNLYTNKPELDEASAGLELSYQSYDRIRGEGFVNIPVSDTMALRVAGYYDKSDGYIKNLAGPDIGAQDDKGFRVAALWTPNDDLEVVARYQYSAEDGNEAGLFGYTFLCRSVTPDGLTDAFGSVRDCANPIRGGQGLGDAANGPTGDPYVVALSF